MNKIFAGIENTSITVGLWMATLLGVIVFRTFLENFAGLRVDSAITTNSHALIHASIYWVTMTIVLTIVLHFATKKDILTISKVALYGSTLILIAPILGFILSKGQGIQMTYLPVSSVAEALRNFFTVYGVSPAEGVTYGMRIEIVIISITVFFYARFSKLSKVKSLITALLVYVSIFISGILPSLFSVEPTYGWMVMTTNTLVGANLIHPMFGFTSSVYNYETFFDVSLSHVLYLILIVGLLIMALRWNKKKAIAIIKNSRFERVAHYWLMVGLGIFLSFYNGSNLSLSYHWLNISSTIILFSSFYFAWMYAVGVNDIEDYNSDLITNKKRPLVTQTISVSEAKSVNSLFLSLALVGGYLVGPEVFVLVLTYIAISHIYSCPPLHLKKYAIINPLMISFASLTAVMAGFFTFSKEVAANSFPSVWIIIIIISYTLLANIKDIKDLEGDKKFGVYTIPVLFGKRLGKLIILTMVVVGLFFISYVLGGGLFWVPAILGAFVMWFVFNQEKFNEKHLFGLYFLYAICLLLIYLL